MKRLSGFMLVLGVLPSVARAAGACKTLEDGNAFFDAKHSRWVESEEVKILQCGKTFQLVLVDAKSKKQLDSVLLTAPNQSEKWFFEGLTCNEKHDDPKFPRNKAILGVDLKVREAWGVDRKKKKWEKISPISLTCHKDEP